MSRSTISTMTLMERFPNEETARAYLESQLWPQGPVCPRCGASSERIKTKASLSGFYRCNACKLDFTVRTGTVFGKSHIPLHIWMHAIYLLVTARKGISSMQLAKELGVRQATAWFMLQRLREACGTKGEKLQGIVEADEAYLTGKESARHMYDRIHHPRERIDKANIIGMRQRNGNTITKVIKSAGGLALRSAIKENVVPGSRIMTDDYSAYDRITKDGYSHESVKHIAEEFVRGDVHTNGIESVWAVLKRGVHGTFHHISKKHLQHYTDEFAFRLSEGNVERHTWRRLDSLVAKTKGRRITYNELTKEEKNF